MRQPLGAHRALYRAVIAVLSLCLAVLAAGYVQLRRQVAEQGQELSLLRLRVEKEHKQNWLDRLYVPYLEQRLLAAHEAGEKGTPAAWRALVVRRYDQTREEQRKRREAGMAAFMQKREEQRRGGGARRP